MFLGSNPSSSVIVIIELLKKKLQKQNVET
jgi:hypothetical protein